MNFRPYLCRPLLRILPESHEPLVPPLKEKLPQCRLTPSMSSHSFNVVSLLRFQGLARSPSQPIRVRSSTNFFNSDSLLGMAGDTFFKGIRTCSTSSSSRASGILLHSLKPSTFAGFPRCNPNCYYNGIPTSQLLVIRKTPHRSFSQQCRSRKWCEGEEECF
jgi:hypothetical protein